MRFSKTNIKAGRIGGINVNKWHVLAVALLVAFLGYIHRVKNATVVIKQENRLRSPSHGHGHASIDITITSMNGDGGFCPISHCKIGRTSIREAFHQAPEVIKAIRSNKHSKRFVSAHVVDKISFEMMIRDPTKDTIISGSLARNVKHEPAIQDLVVKSLKGKRNAMFIDVGANIGYFTATALALGARTVSFEPFYKNAVVLMSTIERNDGWKDRSTLYMNAVGYESNRVTMKSTSDSINLSNMHITGSHCAASDSNDDVKQRQRYGIDYMEGISLDQVMQTNHPDIQRVHLMKIDVETFELHVLNGAMSTLCNVIVERIVVEVEYLKPYYKLPMPCDFDRMRKMLVRMNYGIYGVGMGGRSVFTQEALPDFPPDVVFKLEDTRRSPAERLRGSSDNPCQQFDMGAS